MNKRNPFLDQVVEREIQKRIDRGELYTVREVNAYLVQNEEVLLKIMTVAVNRGIGTGKKRFNEKIYPIFEELLDEYFDNKDTVDQEYAISVVERMYDQIMED